MRRLLTVADFAKESPFSEGQVRWWIFNAKNNGLASSGAIVRIGRRVYLDVDGFDRWISAQNQEASNG